MLLTLGIGVVVRAITSATRNQDLDPSTNINTGALIDQALNTEKSIIEEIEIENIAEIDREIEEIEALEIEGIEEEIGDKSIKILTLTKEERSKKLENMIDKKLNKWRMILRRGLF